jgi:hypothetical protein
MRPKLLIDTKEPNIEDIIDRNRENLKYWHQIETKLNDHARSSRITPKVIWPMVELG